MSISAAMRALLVPLTRLWAVAAVLILTLGACSRGRLPPTEILVVVDPNLSSAESLPITDMPVPWKVGQSFAGELSPRDDGSVDAVVRKLISEDTVEHVWLTLDLRHRPPKAQARAYWHMENQQVSMIVGRAGELKGTISVSAEGVPEGTQQRIVDYSLSGHRHGKPVMFNGRILIRGADMPKLALASKAPETDER